MVAMITLAGMLQWKLLREVEEMKNKEKYEEQILTFACKNESFGVDEETREIKECIYIECTKCKFAALDKTCEECRREWAESEYIEKPVISKRDRAFLEYLDKQYEYIARVKRGQLYVHEAKPYKCDSFWTNYGRCFCLDDRINVDFQMVKWSDEEPWLIEDLKKLEVVEEYEYLEQKSTDNSRSI